MELKEIFDKATGGVLSYEQFTSAVKDAGMKLADLSTGEYVSKGKYESELSAKDAQITKLNESITERDTNLANLQDKLNAAGNDATKLSQLNDEFTNLQTKYDTDIKQYQEQLAKQKYEFAVKDYANNKKFSSGAAKRDFISSMVAKNLQMDGDKILGAEDFLTSYSKENADAFMTETQDTDAKLPTFVGSTNTTGDTTAPENEFLKIWGITTKQSPYNLGN